MLDDPNNGWEGDYLCTSLCLIDLNLNVGETIISDGIKLKIEML